MSVYKNQKTGKWYCIFRVTDWTGKRKQIKKSGFARRADALEYERNYMAKEAGSLEMTFGDLVALYMANARAGRPGGGAGAGRRRGQSGSAPGAGRGWPGAGGGAGGPLFQRGLYYLVKAKGDFDARKIYTVTAVAGAVIVAAGIAGLVL